MFPQASGTVTVSDPNPLAANGAETDTIKLIVHVLPGTTSGTKIDNTASATAIDSTFGADVPSQSVPLHSEAGAADAFHAKYYPYAQ